MAEEGSKDEERALLVAQINSLDEQQQRYLECDLVDKHNEDMTSLCDALRVDQSQSCYRLRRFNLIKEKKEDELEEEQQTQQQAAGQQSLAMELQHSKHMQKLKDQRDRLHSVKRVTAEKHVRLNELDLLKEKVLSEKLKHQAAINCLNDSLDETDECGNKQRQDTLERRIMENTSRILRGDRASHSEQLESLQFLILEESSLLKEKADLERKFSDLHLEKLQKERSRIGKLETIMQDGDIFVNQIMTGSEKSGWKTQWLLETLHSLCPPTLGERPRPQRPAQKEPPKTKHEDRIQSQKQISC
ncbi:hypothetical protein F7725_013244 [Dissostichus mawsoni]|uniref:Uncharacterized protein n=1 Tax=Dissostichus mawsoni TaxID=36200 RepID=A0A7J5YPJ1_DISMA|nr:hypothetical protein F7725_013244 [Dissostichus mawsoni]